MQIPWSNSVINERFEPQVSEVGVRLAWFGNVRCRPSLVIPAHTHGCYELCLITDGVCVYTVDGESYELRSGYLCLTKPGELHSMSSADGNEWQKFYVGADNILPEELGLAYARTTVRSLHGCSDLIPEAVRILEEAERPRLASSRMVQLLLNAWLIEVGRRLGYSESMRPSASRSESVYNACAYIESFAHHRMLVSEVAGFVGLSASHLAHRFSEEMHTSIYRYVRRIVMQRASRLLEEGKMSINQISETLQFPSASYFSASFKRYFGVAPIHYRQSLRPQGPSLSHEYAASA